MAYTPDYELEWNKIVIETGNELTEIRVEICPGIRVPSGPDYVVDTLPFLWELGFANHLLHEC
tara:strand:+ start:157 stop:345 length:189 start_codon:yes stop_codon:yes gene_type:complete